MTRNFEKVDAKIKDGRSRNGGKRRGAGRKLGTPNRLTKDLKELIRGALDAVGGQAYLEKVAREHPQVFCALLARVLPLQHAGEINGTLHVVERTIDRPPEETREQWLGRRARELGVPASGRPN